MKLHPPAVRTFCLESTANQKKVGLNRRASRCLLCHTGWTERLTEAQHDIKHHFEHLLNIPVHFSKCSLNLTLFLFCFFSCWWTYVPVPYKQEHKCIWSDHIWGRVGRCIRCLISIVSLVTQDFEALTPNLLARTIETVEGGGIVVLLLRTMKSLKQLYTMTMVRI